MTAAFVTSLGKADPKTAHLKPIVLEESGLDLSRSVSISTSFTVKVGASFIRTFHTGNLFVEDHNAFKVIVSNTNGVKYKYGIVNDHGWSYESPEYTVGSSVAITNALNVYIVDTGTRELTGHVKISSFDNNSIKVKQTRAACGPGVLSVGKVPPRSRLQTRTACEPFSTAACIGAKTHLGLQPWEALTFSGHRVRWRRPLFVGDVALSPARTC